MKPTVSRYLENLVAARVVSSRLDNTAVASVKRSAIALRIFGIINAQASSDLIREKRDISSQSEKEGKNS